jgi:oxygen-independent coproporphyrinogen-3 oxidase
MVESLKPSGDRFLSLYVHVPFCAAKCPYCAFHSEAGVAADAMAAYLDLLEAEILCRGIRFPDGAATIYLGGGTPTVLPAALLERLLAIVRRTAWGNATLEFSCEVMPATLDAEKAGLLAGAGVNRATLGVQGFAVPALAAVGRIGAAAWVGTALGLLRQAGIRNLGIDLILGLPREDPLAFAAGLEALLSAGGISHVSAYGLSIEPGTPFAARLVEGTLILPEERTVRRYAHRLFRLLYRHGFRQYEVSNFARPGYESLHNSLTWRGFSYAGIGASAVSADAVCRIHNPCGNGAYHQAVVSGRIGGVGVEQLDRKTRTLERLMLGLRTRHGLDLQELAKETDSRPGSPLAVVFTDMLSAGCLKRRGDRLVPTRRGYFWMDGWLARLFAVVDS